MSYAAVREMADRNVDVQNEALEGENSGRPGRPLEVRRLFNALAAARWHFVWAALVGTLVGVVVAKTVVPQEFAALTILEWRPADDAGGAAASEEAMQTLVASVKLPDNIAELRRRLALDSTLSQLGARIRANSSPDSRLLSLEGYSDDPNDAVRLVDTMVEVFTDARVAHDSYRMAQTVKRLEVDRAEAVKRLGQAQAEFDKFRTAAGVVDVGEETTAAIRQLAELRANADLAQAEALAEQARREAFGRAAESLPKVAILSSREMLSEGLMLAEAEGKLSSLKSRLANDHPKMHELRAEIAALKEGLKTATGPTTERAVGINPQWAAARTAETAAATGERAALTRQRSFRTLADENKDRLDRLAAMSGEDRVYRATLTAAETRLATIEAGIATATDAAREPTTGLEVVSQATPPPLPTKSYRKLVAAGIPIAVLFATFALVIFRALRGLKAHTASEVAFWTQVPVVASSCWPRQPQALDDLVKDLCTSWQDRSGRLLVVPLGDSERRAAAALAREILARATEDQDADPTREGGHPESMITLWDQRTDGPAFRRTVRDADWVIVTIGSAAHSIPSLSSLPTQLGRIHGVGVVVVGLDPNLEGCADRAGPVEDFWSLKPQPA